MVLDRAVRGARPVVARAGGEIVKVEGDSLLLSFDDTPAACRGVEALEAFLRRHNRGRAPNEQIRFSYGIGYGDVVEVEGDMFGLEVNLASKIGEDLARPGEALLTPSAGAALDPATLKRVVAYKVVPFGGSALAVYRLKLRR
jgi:class 3 adenylate cyclase